MKLMIRKILFLSLFVITTGINASVPNLINYQGKLTDANGNSLATGDYNLTFKIYEAIDTGTAKWTETHNAVPVVKGFFNVILGGSTPISSAFDTENTYLEITVNDGTPIAPRQRVLSSPYAIKAGHAATADDATNSTNAVNAVNANHASTADNATNSTNSVNAVNANHASTTDNATNASHASTADNATNADHATTADNATNADHATTADNATNAGHATTADNANTVGGVTKDNLAPLGAIMAYWGTTAPEGWLLCDGSGIPADAKYDALKVLVGSSVPDLRGVFLRGLDSGRGYDPDRVLGSYQEDEIKRHNHLVVTDYDGSQIRGPKGGVVGGYSDGVPAGSNNDESAANIWADYEGGPDNHPKNVAVNYIIKY